jgi:hypothetical protein
MCLDITYRLEATRNLPIYFTLSLRSYAQFAWTDPIFQNQRAIFQDDSYLSDTSSSIFQRQHANRLGSSYLSEPTCNLLRSFLSLRDRFLLSLRSYVLCS